MSQPVKKLISIVVPQLNAPLKPKAQLDSLDPTE